LNSDLIRRSFYCGLAIFSVSFLFVLLKELSVLLILSNILPGFIYGAILCRPVENGLDLKRFVFIALSGGLFIFVAWVATGYSFFGSNTYVALPLGSAIGSTVLFLLYYFLIDNQLQLLKGFTVAFSAGLISSVMPFIGDTIEKQITNLDVKGNVSLGFTLLIFVVWQTLFGWTLTKCRKAAANKPT
jgi:hypothetical protein